jgi:hypothetical protein
MINNKKEQFKALTKKYAKDVLKLMSEEPEEEVEEEEKKVEEESWKCEGYMWKEPPEPCKGGEKSNIKQGILFNKKRRIVCKECYLAREREKNKEKREKKKLESPKKRKTDEEEESENNKKSKK